MKTAAALVLVSFYIFGCSDVGLQLPDASTKFVPPEIYRTWWNEMQECSGIVKNFDAITWYYVGNDTTMFFLNTTPEHPSIPAELAGQSFLSSGIILLAKGQIQNPHTVRHEMLHIFTLTPTHPPEVFGPTSSCYPTMSKKTVTCNYKDLSAE